MMNRYSRRPADRRHWSRHLALSAIAAACGHACAIEIDTGNPDVLLTWGNTLRYNAGWRANSINPAIANTRSTDEGTLSYAKGDMVTSRFDLLSELDVSYRRTAGARLSAAGWYDFAFHDHVNSNPNIPANVSSYDNDTFSRRTIRDQKRNAEVLDAYVFNSFDIGGSTLSVKLGRQTTLWGETLILQPFGIADEQSPADTIKATTTPGVDAKEIAMPTGQVSMAWQLIPTLSLLGQYVFEHRSSRLPQGGTYLGSTDFLLDGPDRFSLAPGLTLANKGLTQPSKGGDWGLGLRWTPSWLSGGTVGAYYREIVEKSPAATVNVPAKTYQFFFPKNERALGMSLAYLLGTTSVGADLVYRPNAVLNSSVSDGSFSVARGNAVTGLVNAVQVFGQTAVWSSASLIAEVGFTWLNRVTSGHQYFVGCDKRPAGDQGVGTGCSTKKNVAAALRFTPSWVAVYPGWDASVTGAVSAGISGNSSLSQPAHGQKGVGSYSIGTTWTYNTRHDFTLAYIDYLATNEVAANGSIRVSNGAQRQDRGWVSLTYKGSF